LPEAAVPLLTNTDPLVPVDTAFDVDTAMAPVVPLVLLPLSIVTDPPVLPVAEVVPATTDTGPPTPVLPLPTSIKIAPAEPPTAVPVVSCKEPEPPAAVVPVLNRTDPEEPCVTAFALASETEPVVLPLPPETIVTAPPV